MDAILQHLNDNNLDDPFAKLFIKSRVIDSVIKTLKSESIDVPIANKYVHRIENNTKY